MSDIEKMSRKQFFTFSSNARSMGYELEHWAFELEDWEKVLGKHYCMLVLFLNSFQSICHGQYQYVSDPV